MFGPTVTFVFNHKELNEKMKAINISKQIRKSLVGMVKSHQGDWWEGYNKKSKSTLEIYEDRKAIAKGLINIGVATASITDIPIACTDTYAVYLK